MSPLCQSQKENPYHTPILFPSFCFEYTNARISSIYSFLLIYLFPQSYWQQGQVFLFLSLFSFFFFLPTGQSYSVPHLPFVPSSLPPTLDDGHCPLAVSQLSCHDRGASDYRHSHRDQKRNRHPVLTVVCRKNHLPVPQEALDRRHGYRRGSVDEGGRLVSVSPPPDVGEVFESGSCISERHRQRHGWK
ncbi:hypothetical protein B0T13DRAFT_53309 [Neurospora crassa]|nr:hypothetical protein B0T13DRAFT_53309 [Neurospora crassa]